jgi:hypothetical protein
VVPLEESSWTVTSGSWGTLLADVTSLLIAADYYTSTGVPVADESGLDNIQLVMAPPSGSVPDGFLRPGSPMLVELDPEGNLVLFWDSSCLASDTDFIIYEGSLGNFSSHVPVLCSTIGGMTVTIPAPAFDAYYLVAPRGDLSEGSHGLRGDTSERPRGPVSCQVQSLGSCP